MAITASGDGAKRIRVTLRSREAKLVMFDPDMHMRGVAGRIVEVCKTSRRRFSPSLFKDLRAASFALLLIAILMVSIFLNELRDEPTNRPPLHPAMVVAAWFVLVAIGALFVGLLVWLVVGSARSGPQSSAVLRNVYRAERPSFWKRTADDWAVTAVSSTVFLFLGYFLGKIG
ncbi:hypothetical protein AB0I53_40495 [Saccharopolyspora sp. NPDC050389]|uniref:hypothetical protein n=1 Tax=Saccharopolyspora sp. NPDC050389 TaxID=3155516 RepID=UPI0033DE03F2